MSRFHQLNHRVLIEGSKETLFNGDIVQIHTLAEEHGSMSEGRRAGKRMHPALHTSQASRGRMVYSRNGQGPGAEGRGHIGAHLWRGPTARLGEQPKLP